jgi:hypothetical protein
VKVGDLVVRTYGEGQRPMAIIVGWVPNRRNYVKIKWLGSDRIVQFSIDYLEVISASR